MGDVEQQITKDHAVARLSPQFGVDIAGCHHESQQVGANWRDRKSTRLNSSHSQISYAVFCLKKKKTKQTQPRDIESDDERSPISEIALVVGGQPTALGGAMRNAAA